MKLLCRMFGGQFWSFGILIRTHWGYDPRHVDIRNTSGYGEEDWTRQANRVLSGLRGDPQPLQAVFIDSFYDVGHTVFAENKFRENTGKLLDFALDKVEPFECKDIEKSTLEIREQQQRLKDMKRNVEVVEKQKQSLMMTLEMTRLKNYLLETNNRNLTIQAKSTKSSLMARKEYIMFSHSTTSLIILSFILLTTGLLPGVLLLLQKGFCWGRLFKFFKFDGNFELDI